MSPGSVLDAIKTGRTILPEVVRMDSSKFQRRPPTWKETKEEAGRLQMKESNEVNPSRPPKLGTFIMDTIFRQAKKEGDLKRAQVEKLFPIIGHATPDPDLTAPWLNAERTAARALDEHGITKLNADLDIIREHVHGVYDGHKARMKKAMEGNGKAKKKNKETGSTFTDLPIELRQDVLRASAKEFAAKPDPRQVLYSEEDIAVLRASYAYIHDSKQETRGWSRFVFHLASLCLGPFVTHHICFFLQFPVGCRHARPLHHQSPRTGSNQDSH